MSTRLTAGLLLLAGVAAAAVTGSSSTSPTSRPAFEAIEGTTLQLTLDRFTREDGTTPVTPLSVAYRLDCPPASGSLTASPTPMIPTQALTPGSAVTARIPAHRLAYCAADAILTVSWEWLPGTCNAAFGTSCNANGDCPGSDTCRRSVGQREATLRVARRRY